VAMSHLRMRRRDWRRREGAASGMPVSMSIPSVGSGVR
jgi:hypothetical protein